MRDPSTSRTAAGARRARALGAGIAVVLLDRWTKHLIEAWAAALRAAHPDGAESRAVLGDAIRITYVRNPGMVFGLFARADFPGRDAILTGLSVVAILLLLGYFLKVAAERRALLFGLALVLGGAAGNLVDRFLYGYVIDFVDVSLHFARWPAFNLADSAIVCGVFLMAVDLLAHPAAEAQAGHAGG